MISQAYKAGLLLEFPEQARKQQGRKELDSLLDREPPITEPRAIQTLQAFAELRNDSDSRIQNLWAQAVKVRPQDSNLYNEWFFSRFWIQDLRGAQQASLTTAFDSIKLK